MELKQKTVLRNKGESSELVLKQKNLSSIHVKLSWKKAVDLDLHAFYRTRDGGFGHIYFADRGSLEKSPYIALDQDAGVGNTAGDNEENIRIARLDELRGVLFATNIFRFFGFFSKGDNFAKYDGHVALTTDAGHCIEVPLISEEVGRWCLIARLDNENGKPTVTNINRVQKESPDERSI